MAELYRCSGCLRLRPWCDGASAGDMQGFCDGCTAKQSASLSRRILSTIMPWWFGFYQYHGCPGTKFRPCLICTKSEAQMKPTISEDNLVSFLYELMRDHVPPGVVEKVMQNSVARVDYELTNGWLADYAKYVAEKLQQKSDAGKVAT